MTTSRLSKFFRIALLVVLFSAVPAFFAQEAAATSSTTAAEAATSAAEAAIAVANASQRPAAFYYAIAISIGIGCISAGYAVGKIGAAVMGAAAEKPEIMGKAIAFVGLGEGIALFGFLVALFLWIKM